MIKEWEIDMKAENKLLASVGGVAIASAVVIGAVLGTTSGGQKPPAEHPAGHSVPIASTVTVTAPARPAAITSSRAGSSVAKPPASSSAVHHLARPRRAVVNQEPAVTDTSSTQPDENSTLINQGSGTVDEGGIRRAPAPTGKHSAPPAPPAPPHAPSPS